MLPGRLTIPALFCVCALIVPQAFAQRGRGGGGAPHGGAPGGMQRGGMPGGGAPGGMQRGGAPGGMERGGAPGGMQRGGAPQGGLSGPRGPQMGGGESMGPYGRGGPSGSPSAAHSAAARPGTGASAAGNPAAAGSRPGTRPGTSASAAGNPAAAGNRPGTAATRPGTGTSAASNPAAGATNPAGGATNPANVAGGQPGAGAAGLPGNPAARGYGYGNGYGGYGYNHPYGTYYATDAALTTQRNAMLASTAAYSMYNPARYAGAWQANNMMNASMYANPGYGAVSGMMGMPAQPAPYDYGGNVVSQGNSMYVNGDPAGTTQEYANQAGQIAETGAAEPDAKAAWQPLGVFAMVEPDQADPNDLFQLAVNAQGQVRGNYHNVQTDETTPLAGAVDRKSGRVAWTIGGDKYPIYEAGLANLTRDHGSMLVHTADGQPSQFTLLRLPDPQSAGQ